VYDVWYVFEGEDESVLEGDDDSILEGEEDRFVLEGDNLYWSSL
jgi:hypothetical protein